MSKNYSNWSKEDLIREVQKLEKRKKYGLVWDEEKEPEMVVELCKEKLPVLIETKGNELKTDKSKPTNVLVEGDNYHALSVLNYTHKGQIDIIYIDPPYNTGNGETFKYNDKIVEREDTYRHSKWLSFMEKRLKLAKNLLKSNGVIFISIDDNEVSQLKLLCNEIFGEENFIAQLVWKKKYTGGRNANFFVDMHEYILAYARKKLNLEGFVIERPEEEKGKFILVDEYLTQRGKFYIRPLKSNLELRPTLIYPIKCPDGTAIKTQWIVSEPTFEQLNRDGRILFKKKRDGKYQIYMKYYEKDREGKVIPPSIVDFTSNNEAKLELKKLFNVEEGRDNVLYTVKPLKLIKFLVRAAHKNSKTDTILDFFAGSGTTGQAILELNKEDDGVRKFILCTNNDGNICTEICYPRIKKVINGYKTLDNQTVSGLGGNLKYFKTDFVDGKLTDTNKKKLVDKSTEMLCLKEDCFNEIKEGHNFKTFTNGNNKLLGIIYDDDGIEELKREIKKSNKKFIVYVFSLDDSAREEEFEDVADLVDLKPIPAVILNVYKRIFK